MSKKKERGREREIMAGERVCICFTDLQHCVTSANQKYP